MKGKFSMKILELVIKDPTENIRRKIQFNEIGVSFVYGDILEPENKQLTSNSLGKTLLLKCIDYIFGANENSEIIKKDIHGYILEAKVLFDKELYYIKRILGSSDTITINNEPYQLTEYKNKFQIKRSVYDKQIILTRKVTDISSNVNPQKDDYIACLKLLNLSNTIEDIQNIYLSQDNIKEYKNNKKELVSFYGNINLDQISEEIYFIDKEVTRLTEELKIISNKIKEIEISDMQQDIVEEYADKSKKLKILKATYEKNKIECERLIEFIDNSNKVDVTTKHILSIYEKSMQEIPNMVVKKLEEVEIFHQKVFEERKIFLQEKRKIIQLEMDNLQEQIVPLAENIDKLGAIISVNKVYQESIQIYEKYNSDLQGIKYKQGQLSQIQNIDTKIELEDNNLTGYFENVTETLQTYNDLISKYRDYIYSITKKIYDEEVFSYFNIKIRKKHLRNRPVIFELTLKGDTGEGVNEVKKNLMDYLMCKYNSYMDIMIQDSACYSGGIDPRQVVGMLNELKKLAKETEKQIIISINKYQVGEYTDAIDFISENSCITLSEKDKLLGFDF